VTVAAAVAGMAVLGISLRTPAPPEHLGWYRIVPPARFDGGRYAGTSGSASSVWAAGIRRFAGAVPVNAFYDNKHQPWLYMWGAEGDLIDPAAEPSAFWQAAQPQLDISPARACRTSACPQLWIMSRPGR